MIFLGAFIVCGLLCFLCQLVSEITKAPLPVIAIGMMVVAAFLAPTGAISWLEGVSGMGVIVTIIDAGASLCNGTISAMHGGGVASVVFVFAIFIGVTVIGLIAGAVNAALPKSAAARETHAAGKTA